MDDYDQKPGTVKYVMSESLKFVLIIIGSSLFLHLLLIYIPRGMLKVYSIDYGFVFSTIWGIILGLLLFFSGDLIATPLHDVLKPYVGHHRRALASSIQEASVVALSMILVDQLKKVAEKAMNKTIMVGFTDRITGFVLGRFLVIVSIFFATKNQLF